MGPSDSGLNDIFTTGLVMDPAQPQTLYVATNGRGIYRTTDGGASWRPLPAGLDQLPAQAIAVAPSDTATLYAASEGGVDVSRDGGAIWQDVTEGLTNPRAEAIAVHPDDARIAFAGTQRPDGAYYRTANAGASWTPANGGQGTNAVGTALVFDPQNPLTIYAARDPDGLTGCPS